MIVKNSENLKINENLVQVVEDLSEEFSDWTEILAEENIAPESRVGILQKVGWLGQIRNVLREIVENKV